MFLSGGVVTKSPLDVTVGSSHFPYMPTMSGGWPSAYGTMYARQLWVYTVVRKRARALARLPLPVYRRTADDGRERVGEHPMAQLLQHPNPALSPFDLWVWTGSTYDLHGWTAWYKARDPKAPAGMWLYPLHPASLHRNPETGQWDFDNGKLQLRNIAERDLVIFRDFNPDSLTYGLSPLEPLRATLENEWAARTATSSFWKRGARPGMALAHPGRLSKGAQVRLREQMDDVAAGADKTGVTVVLEEGLKPEKMTLTAEEAQYIETRRLNREEVCAAYDMPPPAVHILDRATFSNITEQFRSVYRDTMGAILPGYEQTLELDLRRTEWPNDDVYAEFLLDGVLRGDFEARQAALSQASHMTIAEKRKVENLPFIDGTDRIFLNAGILPIDSIDAAAQAADQGGADVIPLTVARAVMGRLSWQQNLEQVDPKALVAGVQQSGAVLQALALERASGGDVASLKERITALAKEDS